MTGSGHQATNILLAPAAFVVAEAFGVVPWLFTTAFIVAARLPDWLEVRKGGWTLIKHRAWTHWGLGWALLGVLVLLFVDEPHAQAALTGLALGALVHLLVDWPNPRGVPWLWPTRRHSLKLWRSGEREYLIWLFATFASVLAWTCQDGRSVTLLN